MKKIGTYIIAAIVFTLFGVIGMLKLPDGGPRYLAAGLMFGGWVWAYVASHRANNEPLW